MNSNGNEKRRPFVSIEGSPQTERIACQLRKGCRLVVSSVRPTTNRMAPTVVVVRNVASRSPAARR